ncbi:MAG: acetylxylan esterase [Opitutaceae bacterium]|nr:acetylxylan esterase [Opitutaceae bacterium]
MSSGFAAEAPARPKQDAHGNPIRYAPTGHVSNYDEAKVGAYTLPDPLVLRSGERVRDAATWATRRRPELIALYETEIFGRVPATAPRVSFEVVSAQAGALEGAAVRKHIVVRFSPQAGTGAGDVKVDVVLLLPANARGPVPVLLHALFGYPPGLEPPPPVPAADGKAAPAPRRFTDTGPMADILARGYGYATVRYTAFEGDRADGNLAGVRRLALPPGAEQPAEGEWGTIAAWAWGLGRVLDYLETDPGVDAGRVGLVGHSRLGKTVLWAGARDPRFAVVFSSCSGEMGAALARRDYGETIDDMAANFPWQFTGAFQKYAGRWADMPVDAHTLIALCAPRPVFVTGGTTDQWADPHGEFLALVAAGPVYRLLGRRDLGATTLPPLDVPLIDGELGFHYHSGGHTITPADWRAFLGFADRALKPVPVGAGR